MTVGRIVRAGLPDDALIRYDGGMGRPLAYFLTWTCYGTWLHGDRRGSVDDEHNRVGAPWIPADDRRLATAMGLMRTRAVTLSPGARDVVESTIREHCEHAGWHLVAVNARTNHVHAVVGGITVAPEVAVGQFKSWCTRRLRQAGLTPDGRVWTRQGSTRYLWTQDDIADAADYVLNRQ